MAVSIDNSNKVCYTKTEKHSNEIKYDYSAGSRYIKSLTATRLYRFYFSRDEMAVPLIATLVLILTFFLVLLIKSPAISQV